MTPYVYSGLSDIPDMYHTSVRVVYEKRGRSGGHKLHYYETTRNRPSSRACRNTHHLGCEPKTESRFVRSVLFGFSRPKTGLFNVRFICKKNDRNRPIFSSFHRKSFSFCFGLFLLLCKKNKTKPTDVTAVNNRKTDRALFRFRFTTLTLRTTHHASASPSI